MRPAFALSWMFVPGCALALSAGCDPVHDDAIAALGPEAPGVRQGPLHRPGQPCLLCHDGAIGDPQRFTVAGTVFERCGSGAPSAGAVVVIVDANGDTKQLPPTNAAGNFYVTPGQFDPTFPLQITVTAADGTIVRMQTLVGGNGTVEPNGACASCHVDPPGPRSPGRVCITLAGGGTPP